MRKAYKDAFLKKHNIKLGFMSAFVKAAAYALADQPAVNGGTDSVLVSGSGSLLMRSTGRSAEQLCGFFLDWCHLNCPPGIKKKKLF